MALSEVFDDLTPTNYQLAYFQVILSYDPWLSDKPADDVLVVYRLVPMCLAEPCCRQQQILTKALSLR